MEFAVIDVRNGKYLALRRGVHGREREHDHCVEHNSPLDTLASTIDGVKQRSNALEGQDNEYP